MLITRILSAACLTYMAYGSPVQKLDIITSPIRSSQHKDMSNRKAGPDGKYFHEAKFHPHYDGRFAEHVLGYSDQKRELKNLLQTYLSTFADLGLETWLAHGSLMGWWWNRRILPWDSDVDVQVTETTMDYLAAYYNMSVFHFETPRIPEGRDYMLEINPHYKNKETSDKLNKIDGRWIDTETGLFIDITTVHYSLDKGPGMMRCKDGHAFKDTDIFPLRDTVFENAPAKIPWHYKELLMQEYGNESVKKTNFHDHVFSDDKMEWIPKMKKSPAPQKAAPKPPPRLKSTAEFREIIQKLVEGQRKAEEGVETINSISREKKKKKENQHQENTAKDGLR